MNYDKLKNTELFLFDMDGTLYLGDNVYEGAVELMEDLPRLGKKYIYLKWSIPQNYNFTSNNGPSQMHIIYFRAS